MKMLLGLLFVLLAGNFTTPTPSALAQTTGPATSVTAPVGGACLKGGSREQIVWLVGPNSNHAYISYHGGDSNNPAYPTQTNISGGHPAGGTSLNWTTPAITASNIKIYAEAHTTSHTRIGAGAFEPGFI